MNRYLHRIQELEINDDASSLLDSVIFETNILPNLRVLRFHNSKSIAYIEPLLSPGLLVLDLTTYYSDVPLASFFDSCPLLRLGLKSFRLDLHMHGVRSNDSFLQFLCGLESLESLVLSLGFLDQVSVPQHLLLSPRFRELAFVSHPLTARKELRAFFVPPSEIPFRNVQKLHLTIWWLGTMVRLLRPHDQAFRQLTLFLGYPAVARTIRSFFTDLASSPRRSSLQLVHFACVASLKHWHKDKPELLTLSYDTFQPLTVFVHLLDLRIHLANPISLDDQELVDLVRNWPLLRVFKLRRADVLETTDNVKCITFQGLLALVAICPALYKVVLTLDGRQVPHGVPVRSEYKTITTIRFPGSPISDPQTVADFLSIHFPSVTTAGNDNVSLWMDDRELGKRWEEVNEYLAGTRKSARLET